MTKHKEQIKAVSLRKKGLSLRKIAKKLKISSSTAHIWCKNVKLSKEKKAALYKNAHDPFYGKRKNHIQHQIKQKEIAIKKERVKGIKEIGRLSQKELFISGVSLYWAPGLVLPIVILL